jgi:hypothetical protein
MDKLDDTGKPAQTAMQTAGNSGVANSVVQAILDDLGARALKTIDAVIETLPAGFPGAIADSVRRGVSQRLRLLDAETAAEDIALQ